MWPKSGEKLLNICIAYAKKQPVFPIVHPVIFCLSKEFDKYHTAVECPLSIHSNPSIEVSDWRFSQDNMPLQRHRQQVALYRSVIKVLIFVLILTSSFCSLFSFFHQSFSVSLCLLLVFPCCAVTLCHIFFIPSLPPFHLLRFLCPTPLTLFVRLGWCRASPELKGDRSNGRQHGGEVLQLQHPSNVSPGRSTPNQPSTFDLFNR